MLKRFDTLGIIASLAMGGGWEEKGEAVQALDPNVTEADLMKSEGQKCSTCRPAARRLRPSRRPSAAKGKPGTEGGVGWRSARSAVEDACVCVVGRERQGSRGLTSQCHMSALHSNKPTRVH